MRKGAEYFSEPRRPGQRRYEALRAYFVEEITAQEAANRFDYSRGTIEVWASQLRNGKLDPFEAPTNSGVPPRKPPEELVERIIALRKQRLDVYQISNALEKEGIRASHTKVWRVLKDAGMPRLPKRSRQQKNKPTLLSAPVSNMQELDLSPGRKMECRAPLILTFAPLLSRLDFGTMIQEAGYPGTRMIPNTAATYSLLAMKLLNKSRRNHVISLEEDEGLGLFAGLNVLPKTTKQHEYSYEVQGSAHRALLTSFITKIHQEGHLPTNSFNLDAHTIRHHGEEAILEKNYVPRRSQSTKSILVVYSQEFGSRTLVYGNADTLKTEKIDAVLAFVDFWEGVTGNQPEELVLDSRMTTQKGLKELNRRGIRFITLRSRHPKQVERVEAVPAEQWKRARVQVAGRKYKNPRVLDERVKLRDYGGEIRQVVAKDMGKDAPMFLLTNDMDSHPSKLLKRYALRSPVENAIGEQVEFFHSDALSSDVRLKVDFDVVLDVIASQCYHWFKSHLRGFERVKADQIWRNFLDRPGEVMITETEVVVRVRPFKSSPVLMESELMQQETPVSWWGGRRLRVEFGR